MTPAERLLLACAGGQESRFFATDGVGWAEFLDLADRHGLRALAHRALGGGATPLLPAAAARSLWMASVERQRCNAILSRELARVASALDDRDIACIPFKGPTLSLLAYGDASLREFGDLDVLVRSRDVEAAQHALEALGYRPEYPIPDHARHALLHAHKHYDIVLRGAAGNLVELHWRTDADFPVEQPHESWWESRPRVMLEGHAMRSFTASELMLVLLIHGSKHHWASLHWLADIAGLTTREPIDWTWILERAGQLRCRHRVALGTRLARDLLGAAVPPMPCEDDPRIGRLAAELAEEMFAPEAEPGASKLLARNLALFDTGRQRARHVVDVVFAPTFADWTRWRLPAALAFLYFPLRLARLSVKYASVAIRSLRPRSRIGATLRTPPPRPHSRG